MAEERKVLGVPEAIEAARDKTMDSQQQRRLLDLMQQAKKARSATPPVAEQPAPAPKPEEPEAKPFTGTDADELDRRLRRLGQKAGIGTPYAQPTSLTGLGQAAYDVASLTATAALPMAAATLPDQMNTIRERRSENNLTDEEKSELRSALLQEAAGLPTTGTLLNRPDGTFDEDAAEALRLLMRERGKTYDTAQEAVDNVQADLAEEARAYDAYREAQADGGLEVGLMVNGMPVGEDTITLSPDVSANRALASHLERSPTKLILGSDLRDPELVEALRPVQIDEAVLEVAYDTDKDRRAALRNITAMAESSTPGDVFFPAFMSPDGEWALDLATVRRNVYEATVAHALARTPADTLTPEQRKAVQDDAREKANKIVHRMRNLGVPVYGADPTEAFAEFDRGEGWRGAVVNMAEALDAGSFATTAVKALGEAAGLDLPAPADAARTAMALTLPRLDVAGVVYMPDGREIRAGEDGFAEALAESTPIYGRYLGDNPIARATDWFLRLSMMEGYAAAYSMAMEDAIREHGTVAGYGPEIAANALAYYGSKEHQFRVASRDTDMANVFMTIGNAFDVTTAVQEGGIAPSVARGAGFATTLLATLYDPDAFSLVGPAGSAAQALARASKYGTGLNAYDALAQGGRVFNVNGAEGLQGLENLANNLPNMSDDEVTAAVEALTQQSKQSGSGAPAILSQMAETEAIMQTATELPAGGAKSGVLAYARKTEADQRKYDAALTAVQDKLDKLNAPSVKAAEVAYTSAVRQAEHVAGQAGLTRSLVAQEEARLLALTEMISTNEDVGALNRFLTEIGQKPRSKALYEILNREGVQRVLISAGLEPDKVIGDLRGLLTGTIKSTGDAKADRAARKAARQARQDAVKALQAKLSDALNASTEERMAAVQAELGPRLDALRRSLAESELHARAALQGVDLAGRTLRDEMAKVPGGKALAASDIDSLLFGVEELVQEAVATAFKRSRVEMQAEALPKMRRSVHERYIASLRNLVDMANQQARQGLRQRQSVDEIMEGWRQSGATLEEIAASEDTVKVLASGAPVSQRILDDLELRYPDPAERERATMALFAQQRLARETMLDPDSRARLYRQVNAPEALMSLNGLANTAEAVYWRTAGLAKTFMDMFSLGQTGYDTQVSQKLAANARMAEKDFEDLKSNFDWLVQYGEGTNSLEGTYKLADEFVTVPKEYKIRTRVKQEVVLDAQVGRGTAILDDATEALRGLYAVHVLARSSEGEYPALLQALVKSYAPELLTPAQAEDKVRIVAGYLLEELRKADEAGDVSLVGRSGLNWLRETLRTGWAIAEAPGGGDAAKSQALFYNTLMALSAMHKQNLRMANIVGPNFNDSMMRATNYLMSEGRDMPAELLTDYKVGDYVVDARGAVAFNEVLNTPKAISQPYLETNAGRIGSPIGMVREVDRAEDPRLSGNRRDFFLEQMLRDENVGLPAYRIIGLTDAKGAPVDSTKDAVRATVVDSDGMYHVKAISELTLRDPRVSYLDGLDGVLMYGMKMLMAQEDAAKLGDSTREMRREYQKLIAVATNDADELQYAPRDLVDKLVERLDRIEKDIVAPINAGLRNSAAAIIANAWRYAANTLMSVFRQSILYGLFTPRLAMLTTTSVGDTAQMFLEIGPKGLNLGMLGTIGYLPIVGPYWQRVAADWMGGAGAGPLPTWRTNRALRAVLEKGDNKLFTRNGAPLLDDAGRHMTAAELGYEARMRGAGDNIATPDAIRAMRQHGQQTFNTPSAFGRAARAVFGTVEDWMKALERQVSRGTKAQRLMFYAEARLNGASPAEAEAAMKRALFEWDTSSGEVEKRLIAGVVLFYTLKKNALAQVHRTLFESMDIGVEEYTRRYMRGQTKMQRMELMSRLAYAPLMLDTRPEAELTPEEAQMKADIQAMADYLEEYPIAGRSSLSDKQREYMRQYMGVTNYEYAYVLPKVPAAELIEYMELVNLLLVAPSAAVMDAISGDDSFDSEAWMRALVEFLEDQATPIYAPLIRGFAEANNMITPYSGSDYGENLTIDEMQMVWALGWEDSLVPTDRGMRFKAENSLTGWFLRFMRRGMLTEYVHFKTAMAAVPGSEYVTPEAVRFVGRTLGWEEARIEAAAAMPDRFILTDMEQGRLRAKLQMWGQMFGVGQTYFYSGRKNQMWEKDNAKAWADLRENLELKRTAPIVPGQLEVR